MLPGWVWGYVFIANVLQLLGLLLLIAGIGMAVYQVAKELIKFNKNLDTRCQMCYTIDRG